MVPGGLSKYVARRSTHDGISSHADANPPPATTAPARPSPERTGRPATTPQARSTAAASSPVSTWLVSVAARRAAANARERPRWIARHPVPSASAKNHMPQAWVHMPEPRQT